MEVLDIACSGSVIAAALSDGSVRLFHCEDGRMSPAGALLGHGGPVTAVAFATPQLLITVSSDGIRELALPHGGGDTTQPQPR